MPIIKSAAKRARQAIKRKARRLPFKTNMKTIMRSLSDLVKEGRLDEAQKILPAVYKSIDTAAKKQIIHKKNASRKKSLMSRMLRQKTTK
ncbi:MAG: 30S ribosomal protein S20 [Candidatus Peregrinibacteria bacterium]